MSKHDVRVTWVPVWGRGPGEGRRAYLADCCCGWTSALYEDEERATVAGHQHIARRR